MHRRALEPPKKKHLMSKDKNEAVMRGKDGYSCHKNKSHTHRVGLQWLSAATGAPAATVLEGPSQKKQEESQSHSG